MRKLQSISFNLTDDDEKELYDHAMKQKYFSRYVKKLIAQDKAGAVVPRVSVKEVVEAPYIEEIPQKALPVDLKQDNEEDVFNFF